MMGGELPDERIVKQMEAGVTGFRYDHAGIFPSEIPDTDLTQMRCPTLILVGENERIYNATKAVSRAEDLVPDVTARIIPGLGHLLGMQDAPLVNTRIDEFLNQHLNYRR